MFFGNSPTSYIHTCLEVPISRTTDLSSKYNPYAFSVRCNLNSYIFKRQTLYHWLFFFLFLNHWLKWIDMWVIFVYSSDSCVNLYLIYHYIGLWYCCVHIPNPSCRIFFPGKSKVKCNYIVMFITYSAFFYTCINVNCNVPASDKHFYRTLLNSILSKIYLSPSFDSS